MSVSYSRRSVLGIGAALLAAAFGTARAAISGAVAGPVAGGAPAMRLPRFPDLAMVPDGNGFLLPPGFSSRVIAQSGQAVPGTTYTFLNSPDGAGIVPSSDGGWWLLWNGESPKGGGGVAALRFAPNGAVAAAAGVLTGLNRACAGGVTPWGTWLACEEVDHGTVWEVDPTGVRSSTQHVSMGRFAHEAAAVDGVRRVIYLSEDEPDGLFYRYRYADSSLAGGMLEAAVVDDGGAVKWLQIPDPSAAAVQCRAQVAATPFKGGEGLCIMDGRLVFLTTKGDNRVWRYDVVDERMDVLYQPSPGSVLAGVDNIAVTPGHDLLVCEDGGNMELVAVELSGRSSVVARLTGQSGSELTGVNVSPDGRRVYVGSQRAISATQGIVYELTGPFPW